MLQIEIDYVMNLTGGPCSTYDVNVSRSTSSRGQRTDTLHREFKEQETLSQNKINQNEQIGRDVT
jgi:hypothetical protein